jgi:hypothetical protein
VLRSYLKELDKIDTIIEIGTYQGVSTAILAEYAKKVYTFDVVDMHLRPLIWKYLNIKNISFEFVENNKERDEKIKKILGKEKVSLCFIDGEHSKGQPKLDLEVCKKCNSILFHDYAPAWNDVYSLCNNIKGYEKTIKPSFCLLTKKSQKNVKNDIKPKLKIQYYKENSLISEEEKKNRRSVKSKNKSKRKTLRGSDD